MLGNLGKLIVDLKVAITEYSRKTSEEQLKKIVKRAINEDKPILLPADYDDEKWIVPLTQFDKTNNTLEYFSETLNDLVHKVHFMVEAFRDAKKATIEKEKKARREAKTLNQLVQFLDEKVKYLSTVVQNATLENKQLMQKSTRQAEEYYKLNEALFEQTRKMQNQLFFSQELAFRVTSAIANKVLYKIDAKQENIKAFKAKRVTDAETLKELVDHEANKKFFIDGKELDVIDLAKKQMEAVEDALDEVQEKVVQIMRDTDAQITEFIKRSVQGGIPQEEVIQKAAQIKNARREKIRA